MKKLRPGRITLALALFILSLAPAGAFAQAADPLSVVNSFIEAMNAHDLDAAAALVADDVVLAFVPPMPGSPPAFRGKEQFRRVYSQPVTAGNIRFEPLEPPRVEGNKVTRLYRLYLNALLQSGVGPVDQLGEYTVVDGKIESITLTLTPESVAKVAKAGPPPAGMPRTGGLSSWIGLALSLSIATLVVLIGVGLRLRLRLRLGV